MGITRSKWLCICLKLTADEYLQQKYISQWYIDYRKSLKLMNQHNALANALRH